MNNKANNKAHKDVATKASKKSIEIGQLAQVRELNIEEMSLRKGGTGKSGGCVPCFGRTQK